MTVTGSAPARCGPVSTRVSSPVMPPRRTGTVWLSWAVPDPDGHHSRDGTRYGTAGTDPGSCGGFSLARARFPASAGSECPPTDGIDFSLRGFQSLPRYTGGS